MLMIMNSSFQGLVPIVFGLVLVVGFVGNILVIAVVSRFDHDDDDDNITYIMDVVIITSSSSFSSAIYQLALVHWSL